MSRRLAAFATLALLPVLSLLTPLTGSGGGSMAVELAEDGCRSSITPLGGRPWRSADCTSPGYTNVPVPLSPVVNAKETQVLRTLPAIILNIDSYAEPVHYAARSTPLRRTRCIAWGCVGGNSVPLRGDETVAPGSDAQLVVVDAARGRSYEMWEVARDADGTVRINSDGSVTVGSLSVVDLHGRGNTTPDGERLNITGSGVSRIFGLIRSHEVRAAASSPQTAIPHALQVSLPYYMNCSRTFRAPATKSDGRAQTTQCVQEGARVHLSRSFDCWTVATQMGKAVCFALRRYGAYVMDNGGARVMAVYAQHRDTWARGNSDYQAAGIRADYQKLGIPLGAVRALAAWNGR